MTDTIKNKDEIIKEFEKEQEKALRDQLVIDAKKLGLEFAGNIGYKSLKEMYDNKLEEIKEEEIKKSLEEKYKKKLQEEIDKAKAEFKSASNEEVTNANTQAKKVYSHSQARLDAIKRATKLVRCRIQIMNPNKKEITGEIFTVSNSMIGSIKKMIPYDPKFYEDGYHVPYAILQMIKNKKYLSVREVKTKEGYRYVSSYIPEFAVQELDPLTEEELLALSEKQEASHSLL